MLTENQMIDRARLIGMDEELVSTQSKYNVNWKPMGTELTGWIV